MQPKNWPGEILFSLKIVIFAKGKFIFIWGLAKEILVGINL